ncbi:alkaline phosphatase family protein [Alloacidobacterium sp.]|uniref:alkaline phosphatase family protein n=1 Tax=Alloacidobacterium sp. TaxID=2951999 RepID=UPI002D42C639|nr:alkaline phosphatase family protein [Alloacidobacterium sp.]HYK36202.1 alkaline phosphatase family protein [Alloacidobacterium sp.]
MGINRRDFIRSVAGVSGAALAGAATSCGTQIDTVNPMLPSPDVSGIEHIVVVMMENRSFDHLLGWMPNANGSQAGLQYTDKSGITHATYRLTTFAGCSYADPDHSYSGGRSEYNAGKMDAWLRTGTNDTFSIGYYEEADLPLFSTLARNYTTLCNYFPSIMSSTFPNRFFQHSAQTDRLDNSLFLSTLPTIWDRLQSAGISCKYYFSNVPFLALWGLKYVGISASHSEFLTHAANGTLPAVSFVDPWFTTFDEGNDDHPFADLRNGEIFLRQVVEALANGPDWSKTVLIINRDEWGGFFDHVVPPRATAANAVDTDIVDGKTLLGCRVPVLVISPFSKGNPGNPRINSLTYDHTSVLKLIEWRWQLQPLTPRDSSNDIANLALALDFSNPDTSLPALPVITPPAKLCSDDEAVPTIGDQAMSLTRGEPAKRVDNESLAFYLLLKSELMNGWLIPAGIR